MSEPRYSLIWQDVTGNWWLDIVRWDIEDEKDRLSSNADTIGPFDSFEETEEYLGNYQNIGYETPVMSADQFPFLDRPKKWVNKTDPYAESKEENA